VASVLDKPIDLLISQVTEKPLGLSEVLRWRVCFADQRQSLLAGPIACWKVIKVLNHLFADHMDMTRTRCHLLPEVRDSNRDLRTDFTHSRNLANDGKDIAYML